MAWKSIVVGSALTAAVAAGAFYAGAGIGARPAWAEGVAGHWSAERPRGGDHLDRFCADGDRTRFALLLGIVRERLDLRPEQGDSWRDLEGAISRGMATLQSACGKMQAGAGGAASAPVRLAAAEAAMSAGAEALRQVRPAFDTFYATLDDGQRATLDAALAHRRHR